MPTFAEFFAGGGMARVGLGADWRCTFANDICAEKGASYAANLSAGELRVADVATLTPADLPGAVDLTWASPPCQDVSLAGARAGLGGSRSGAFWPWWRLMQGLIAQGRAPRLIAIENVEALITSSKGSDFAAIVSALSEAGYVVGTVVVDAALFVPQSRARLFIVAARSDVAIPPALTQGGPTEPFHPRAMVKAVAKFPLPLRAAWRWWRLPTPPLRNTTLLDLLALDAPCDDDAETQRLIDLMAPPHLAKIEQARAADGPSVGAICRRMRDGEQRAEIRFDGLAHALRTPGGGSSIQRFLLIDGDGLRSRRPTPRECARLMGLPDAYVLPYSTQDAYRLTGDGVVAAVVRWLAAHLLEPLFHAPPYRTASPVAGKV